MAVIREHVYFIIILGLSFKVSLNYEKLDRGRKALVGEFPYVVSIMRKKGWQLRCGGIIVNRRFVITACHCVGKLQGKKLKKIDIGTLFVVGGSINRFPGQGGQVRYVDMTIIQEGCSIYKEATMNDSALLRITRQFIWTPRLKPMPIYSKNKTELEVNLEKLMNKNAICSAIGWGDTRVESIGKYNSPSSFLLVTSVILNPVKKCQEVLCSLPIKRCFRDLVMRGQICAFGTYLSDVCHGDSGGPLICSGHVYGLVGWGPLCGELRYPTMYQRIDSLFNLFLPLSESQGYCISVIVNDSSILAILFLHILLS